MVIKTAMLLAAGRGERLRPLTASCPKPLLPIKGKPLIVYWLERLAAVGVERVVINVHYLGEQIVKSLGSGDRYGLHIHYSYENELLGTAGGVQNALPLLGSEPFLLISSDIFTSYSISTLVQSSQANTNWLHAILVPNPSYHLQGDYALCNNRLTLEGEPRYTFSAIALVHPCIFQGDSLINQPMDKAFRRAIAADRATGELFEGMYHNVGTVNEYESLQLL